MKQQKNVFDQSFSINPSDYSFQFFCYNGVNLKWNDVFQLLRDYQNEGVKTTPMTLEMLLQNAEIISTNIGTSGSALHDLDSAGIEQFRQVRKMFMKDDNINLLDEDFPIPGYLLNTSGYTWLQNNPQNQTPVNNHPSVIIIMRHYS